jgi:hypothetical protein
MTSPTKNGLSISDVESQYDTYLLKTRGLSRSTRNLHHQVVHRFLSSRFQIGYLSVKCPANFPEARSGREGTLQGYRDYFRIADNLGVDRLICCRRPQILLLPIAPKTG